MTGTVTYWDRTAAPARHPRLERLPATVDAVVVGAGYTGLAAAHRLVRHHGRQTLVLDSQEVGAGASGRNAGMVVPHVGKVPLQQRLDGWGESRTKAAIALGQRAMARLRDFVQEERLSVGFQPATWLIEAATPDAGARLERDAAIYRRLGVATVGFERVPNARGTGRHGALHHEGCAVLQPLDLARSLADLAHRQGGVTFGEGVLVRGFDRTSGGIMVQTDRGTVRCPTVLIATNGYTTRHTHADLRGRVGRLRGYVVVTSPLSPDQWEAVSLPPGGFATDTRRLVRYWRRLPDERLLFGGPGPPVTGSERRGLRATMADLRRRFPALSGVTLDYGWSGWLGAARDRMPHVGVVKDVGAYALGYAGTGIALSLYCGEALADLVVGRTSDIDVRPLQAPLPRFPLSAFLPVIPTMARLGLAIQDRLP